MKRSRGESSLEGEEGEEEEELQRLDDKFAELRNELNHGWTNGGYINSDRISKEFDRAVAQDGQSVHDDDEDKHSPQH
eukprot:3781007-Ditylum_brightwellii.AAC.1